MFSNNKMAYVVTFFITAALFAHAQEKGTFSIQDSVLLFGGYDQGFKLIAAKHLETLHAPPGATHTRPVSLASLGRNGELVAWGFPIKDDSNRTGRVRCAVGVYSNSAERWKTFGDFGQVYTTAISPDGSQVAFIAGESSDESRDFLRLLNVATGRVTEIAKIPVASISWSPDGKRLVLTIQRGERTLMEIFDIASSSVQVLGEGKSPTWAPSGDSIAYVDASNQKIHLVHADGTDDRVLKDVGGRIFGYRYFGLGPVWSPDSSMLLVNEYKGDGDYLDVVLLDVKSGAMTAKSHNGYPVLGWAQSSGKATTDSNITRSRSAGF